ncbi:hypothetical protein J2W96_006935 [Variovorax guangxiensis]|nr:hypothetical protein [Variovorax guangxiensis]
MDATPRRRADTTLSSAGEKHAHDHHGPPLTGKPAPNSLIDLSKLLTAYVDLRSDLMVLTQWLLFGTSGRRGGSLAPCFSEWHVPAMSQTILVSNRGRTPGLAHGMHARSRYMHVAFIQEVAMSDQLDQQCIDTIRFLSVDAVQKANSGHPGMPLGAAPMAYVLWTRFLRAYP